jgi:hypothetical protein
MKKIYSGVQDKAQLVHSQYAPQPNLLLNGDFRECSFGTPVPTNVAQTSIVKYFIDGWAKFASSKSKALHFEFPTDTGIDMRSDGTGNADDDDDLRQITYILPGSVLGKIVTLSISENGTVYSVTGKIPSDSSAGTRTLLHVISENLHAYFMTYTASTGYYYIVVDPYGRGYNVEWSTHIDFIKLEQAEYFTGYHPDPLERIRCMQYYETSYAKGAVLGAANQEAGAIQHTITLAGSYNFQHHLEYKVRKLKNPAVMVHSPITGVMGYGNLRRGSDNISVLCSVVTSNEDRALVQFTGQTWQVGDVLTFHYIVSAFP